MPNRDGNGGHSFSYVAYPVVSGKDGEDHAAAAELLDDEVVRDGLADQ
jgi:hypothetical protein